MKTVVALGGSVDAALVEPILGPEVRLVANPQRADLSVAEGALVRAAAVVDAAELNRMPKLRVLARTGVGVDRVDVAAAAARGIPVVITPGSNTNAVAEGAFAHLLQLIKRLGPLGAVVRTGHWAARDEVVVGDLEGATLGVVGYGRIGRRVAELAAAFGMDIVAYDPLSPPTGVPTASTLAELLAASQAVSLHLPLTKRTRQLINAATIAAMRPGAVLINVSRGALIDLDAAYDALLSGRLGGLGLDVFDPEPPPPHAIFEHPDVSLTPHRMGLSVRATAATMAAAARGIADVFAGRQPAAVAAVPAAPSGGSTA